MIAAKLDAEVRAVCPIHGVRIGRKNDKSTWRIDFKDEATAEQRAAAQAVVDAFDAEKVVHNAAIDAQIKALEGSQLWPRGAREKDIWDLVSDHLRDVMGVPNPRVSTPEQRAQAIAALSDKDGDHYNAGFVRLKAFDDQITALRAQRV